MSSLADREQQTLLEFARRALIAAVERSDFLENLPANEILQRPAGAFVTLRRRGRLRGCVGQLAPADPLIQVGAHCPRAAAVVAPRFEPDGLTELPVLDIQMSVLSTRFPIS